MRKVLIYSLLLVAGLAGSQFLARAPMWTTAAIHGATLVALSFIMVHVGYEFEIDKARPGDYGWDAFVAFAAASLPWAFCAAYFVLVMEPSARWREPAVWTAALLKGLFAAPTSAGVLFAMMSAAGLAATWVFRKARVLAIFDDLSTILLLIPLKVLLVGFQWHLVGVLVIIVVLLWAAWRYLHRVRLPMTWPWVLGYAAFIAAAATPVHLEVLLPAFVLGCVMARPLGADPHADDATEGTEEGPETPDEQFVATIVSACFMVLVGLSMPPILAGRGAGQPGWGVLALHVLAVTLLSNVGKLFPVLCYRREVSVRERFALAVGMFPRGEVGAGVLVVSLSYGMAGPALTVAVLSLVLNLVCTGAFIVVVKKLLASGGSAPAGPKIAQ